MPLPKFHEVLADPTFQTATTDRQSEINNAYWNAYDKENPGDEWGKQQRADTTRALQAKSLAVDAPPVTKRALESERAVANARVRLRNMDAAGEFKTPEERKAAVDAVSLAEKDSREKIQKTASLFTKDVDEQMQPAWKALERSASDGQYFDEQGIGTKTYNAGADLLPGGQSYEKTQQSRKFYEDNRNKLAQDFNLEAAEVDDIVRHRMGKQKDPVSRDAAGKIHIKDELLVKPVEEIASYIEKSNLSATVKKQAAVDAPFKVASFKEGVIQNVQKNHPDLASEIKFTGDVSKDYVAITEMLNDTATEQFGGGMAAHGLGRAATFAGRQQTEMGDFVPAEQMSPQDAREGALRLEKRQQAINQLSEQINQGKVQILGTDAATVGQGVASMAESMVITGATGGLGNALISAERIAGAGKVGAALLKFGQGAANIAPTAGIYGVDQGLSTYEQALKSDNPEIRARAGELALKSGAIETLVTMTFSGFGAGGAETMAQRLASGEVRREAAKSMGQAWKNLGKNLVGVPLSEIPEETLITALDSVHVQTQLNPGMTDADVKKAIRDTAVSTLISTAPMGGFNVAVNAKKDFSKPTHEQTDSELHDASDATYTDAAKENLPKTQSEGGNVTPPSPARVAPKMSRAELVDAIERKRAAVEMASAGNAEIKLPDGTVVPAVEARARTYEEQQTLEALQGTPEEVAAAFDVELVEDQQDEKQAEVPNTEEASPPNGGLPAEPNPPLPGETPVADTPVGEAVVPEEVAPAPIEKRIEELAAGPATPTNVVELLNALAGVRMETTTPATAPKLVQGQLFQGDKPRVSDTDYAYPISGAITSKVNSRKDVAGKALTPVIRNVSTNEVYTGHMHASAFVKAEENNDSGIFESGFMTDDGEYFRKYEDSSANQDNLWEVNQKLTEEQKAELKKIEDSGSYFETAEQVREFRNSLRKSASSNEQLFQNPESQGDPAAIKLVQSYKGSPPKGATRSLIDYAGEPLLADLGDLPAHTIRDIKEADQIIQENTGKNGKAKLGRVGFNKFLSQLWKRHHRGKSPGWHNFQSRRDIREMGKILSFEVAHALSKDKSGVDWYREKISSMYDTMGQIYPELKGDTEARFLFSVMLAVTSNGQTVVENLRDTAALYEQMRGKSRLPVQAKTSRSERNAAVQKAFREINSLLDENSWQDVKNELLAPHTVSELKKKFGLAITGELSDHNVIGAMILGPKIGSFWGNLNERYDSITMDLWFTRTMNRLSGDTATMDSSKFASDMRNLLSFDIPIDVKNDIKKYLADAENGDKSWVKVPSDIRESLEHFYDFAKKTYSQYASSGFTDRSDFNKNIQKLVKELDGGEDTPDNGTHRKWMRDVVGAAQEDLKKHGVNITNADLQAILWFHEKDLYTRFGATSQRGERTDYAQAAGRVVDESRAATGRVASVARPADAGEAGPTRSGQQLTLFQDEKAPKGTYTYARGAAQAQLDFMESADATTGAHEWWHGMREGNFFGILTDEEIQTLTEWETGGTGVRDRDAKEKGARGWERFLFEGTSTGNAKVDAALTKLAEWMGEIYKQIQGTSINVDISPEVRAIMEKLLTRGVVGAPVVNVPVKVAAVQKPAPAKKVAKTLPDLPRPQSRSTSIKNAATDKYLTDNGMAPMLAPARQSNEETWDMAMARVEANDQAGSNVVKGILNSERSVTDEVEEGVLLHEMAIRKARVARARNDVMAAHGNEDAVREAQNNLKEAQSDLMQAIVAAKLAGTAWGRIGQFRQRAIAEDFSLEAMEARFAAEINDGAPLSADQSKVIAELHKKIVVAEARTAEVEAEISIKQREVDALLKRREEKKPRATPERRGLTERVVAKVEGYRDSLAKMGYGRLSQKKESDVLNQDPESELPPEALEAFGGIAAAYILEGKSENEIIQLLNDEFGIVAVDNDAAILDNAREQLNKTSAGSRAKTPTELFNLLEPDKDISNKLVFNMVRGMINEGVPKEKVLKKVLKLLQEKFPALTYDELSDIFTGYGKIKEPSQEKDLIAVRELRNIERIQRQIREVRAGNTPKKTGQQRDAATLRIRELQKELKDAFKAAGIKHRTNKKQLAGALDAIKTRLKNELEDLDKAIRTNTPINRKKTQIEYDKEIKDLQARRDTLRKEYDKQFGVNRKAMSDSQRLKSVIKALNKRIAEERALAQKGLVERINSSPKPVTNAEVDALKATLTALVEARSKARAALYPSISEEQRAMNRAESVSKRLVDYYQKVLAGTAPGKATPVKFTPGVELAKLITLKNDLKAAVKEMRKQQRQSLLKSKEERSRNAAIKALERSVADLEARVARGDLSPRTRAAKRTDLDAELLKRQKAAQEALKALKEAALPSKEERLENSLIRATETRIAKLQARIAAGDYIKIERVPAVMSTKLAAARLAESKVKEEWNRGFFEKQLAERSFGKKTYDSFAELLNFSRTMKTIADVSAVLRQGMVTALGRPVLSIKAIPGMFLAGFSEVQHQRIKDQIENHPLFGLSQQAKLFIADTGMDTSVAKIEEAFRGRWAKKIPGISSVVGFSERTYNAYLNQVRMAQFANMVEGFTGGKPTVKEAKIIANYVNRATGRGDLKNFESAAAGLAAAFFSPKFVVSRFQVLWGLVPTTFNVVTGFQLLPKDIRRAKIATAKEYARLLVGISAVYGLAILAKAGFGDDDDDWELDLRSSKFGRVRIGNTSIDPMGGLLQAATFGARMLPTRDNGVWRPYTKTGSGEVVSLWRSGFGKQSYVGVMGQFLRTKLSPVPASVINMAQGEDVIGQPVTWQSEAIGSVVPLVFGDVYDTLNENGVKGTPLAVAAMFGLGVQTRNNEMELEQWLSTKIGVSPQEYQKKSPSGTTKLKIEKIKL